jgi:hypothetical protein
MDGLESFAGTQHPLCGVALAAASSTDEGGDMLPRARSPLNRNRGQRMTLRRVAIAELVLLALAAGSLMVAASAWVGFGLAVAAAFWWCRWLEQNPDVPRREPGPGPNGGTRVAVGLGTSVDIVASSESPRRYRTPKAA